MLVSPFLNRAWHYVKGDKKVFTVGESNVLNGGRFAFFYDYDIKSNDTTAKAVTRAEEFFLSHEAYFDLDFQILQTAHGIQLKSYRALLLKEVRELFLIAKSEVGPTDYFWSVPLWLRIAPKWDRESGEVISPAPMAIFTGPKTSPKSLPVKKSYATWY